MPRSVPPVSDIDWARLFSLPVGVPPSGLLPDERVQYALALEASAWMPLSSHGRYFSDRPRAEFRVTIPGMGVSPEVVLPRHGRLLAGAPVMRTFSPAKMKACLLIDKFNPSKVPATGDVAAVDAALQEAVPTDKYALQFSPLPVPCLSADTVEFFWADRASWLPAGLKMNSPGVLDATGIPVAEVPEQLLTTSRASLGEIDRLLLRSPVTGRYRFDPYYVYRRSAGDTLTVVGPSSTGRLVIEQPQLTSVRDKVEHSKTGLFEARRFAFDHVARADVATLAHAQLAFQFRHIADLQTAFADPKKGAATLAIPGTSGEVMNYVGAGVRRLLRTWCAFLALLRWRAQDTAAAAAIKADWLKSLTEDPKTENLKALAGVVDQILASPDVLLESLLYFSRQIYSRRLAGYCWTEILKLEGAPATARFPLPKDQPPFNANDAESKKAQKQHALLRLPEDPGQRWVACWAGAPIGRPAPVYATSPSGSRFPADGVTTYELEALHAGVFAAGALGVPQPVLNTLPAPGRVADLSAFSAKQVGRACWFTAGIIDSNPLHSTADWLIELTRGTNVNQPEEGFVDLMSLVDRIDPKFGGHPLVAPLYADFHEKAVHVRRQMDAAPMAALGKSSLTWWDSKVSFNKVGDKWHQFFVDDTGAQVFVDQSPTPPFPYDDAVTRPGKLRGVLDYDALVFLGRPTGYDSFDIESAWLAAERVRVLPAASLPVQVVLALMEREGVKQFASINRRVRHTSIEADTLVWEALRLADEVPKARLRTSYPPTNSQMARVAWLSYPYGLDHYAKPDSDVGVDGGNVKPADAVIGSTKGLNGAFQGLAGAFKAGVLALDPAESVGKYISSRVWSTFVPSPPIAPRGTPRIWKLNRRMHWAAVSLMVAYFREIEAGLLIGTDAFAIGAWQRDPAWVTPPPSLVGKTPADPEWKDFLSYFGMIYVGHNGGPSLLAATLKSAEAVMGGTLLSHRDFLLFKHRRDHLYIGNMVRFVIGLDAYLRLNFLDGVAPVDFPAKDADITPAAERNGAGKWGI